MIPARIVFFGTPHFVIPIVEKLNENYSVVGVVTAPDTLKGRGNSLTPSPIKQFVQKQLTSIPVYSPDKLTNEFAEELKALNPDIFVVAAYGKIIPNSILSVPKLGAINIHPSLLPLLRGPSPIQTAILQGVKESGITIIKMDEKMDHGPIISQWGFIISPTDTFETLQRKMFEDASVKIPVIISNYLNNPNELVEQDDSEATYCQIIKKEDGYFSLDNPPNPEMLQRMIHAFYPWPTVWTKVKTKTNEEKILKLLPNNIIQIEGKKPMGIKDFYNGYPELKQLLEGLLI